MTTMSLEDKKPEQPEQIVVSVKFIKTLLGGFLFFVLLSFAISYFKNRLDTIPKTYDECVSREGSRIQESYPATCITREGDYFVQPIDAPAALPNSDTSAPSTLKQCKRTGCSGQFCVEITAEEVISTCEYRAEYACYQAAPCEVQPDGECGFTDSIALKTCIEEANSQSIVQ
jgi:hypothetical protein